MKSIAERLKLITWYQWLLISCLFLYLVFLSLSWFYMPGKLKQVIENDASGMIGREISVEKISFNPFTLSLSADNFIIPDQDEEHLIRWDRIVVNLGFWRSVFTWGIVLDQFSLDSPKIRIERTGDGFNFEDIVEKFSTPEKNNSSGENDRETGSISIEIFNTSINSGEFVYSDTGGNIRSDIDFDNISLKVEELYFATGDEHLNPFSLKAQGPGGSQIAFEGNYRIDPLHVEGNIRGDEIDLHNFSSFLENIIPLKINKGTLSLSTDILADNGTEFMLKTGRGSLSMSNLLLDDEVQDPSMLIADRIELQGCSLDVTEGKVTVEKVFLDGIILNQWIDENGEFRFEALLAEKSNEGAEEEKPPVESENAGQPWDLLIKQVSLKNSALNFDDKNQTITRGHSLSEIDIGLKDISLAPENKMSIQLAALLDEKGTIGVEGSMGLSPFSLKLNYQMDKILLNPFSEYLEAASWLEIEDGSLWVAGKASISEGTETSIKASASLGVDDFRLKDSRSGKPVLGLKAFKVDDINAEVDEQKVSIASVSISKPEINLSMSDKKELNLADLMKENKDGTTPDTPEKSSDESPGWKYEIDKVSMSDGTLLFSDNSVKPAYKTGMYNMTFSLDKIGSDITKPAPFSFKSEIDKYAPFTITGTLDPIDRQPGFAFKSALKGLDMPHLSPYSGVYIGNNLKSGKLSLNLDYTLHDRKLKGKNNINAKNLYLGDKVSGEPVVNAPVGLGLALLRDISGVIDLNVGVAGDLDDPGFSVAGVIAKALVNIIVKAAASPFKLLGALIPGGGEDLGNVTFDPGSPVLNQANRESLKNLSDALKQRPQLILSVKGNAGTEDIEALKKIHLMKLIAGIRDGGLSVLEEELKTQELWMIAENRTALETINDDMGLPSVSQRLKELLPAGDSENAGGTVQDTSTEEQTVYKTVYDDIIAALKINEDELLSLADNRALSIKQHLVDELELGHERVSVIKARNSDLTGRVIELSLDAR